MKKVILLTILTVLISESLVAQSKQATHLSISAICNGQVSFWDNETAILNFNSGSQLLTMTTDLFEITDDYTRYEHPDDRDVNGIPVTMTTTLSIDGLDFKSAKNNGETFTFETQVTCNGVTKSIPATYTFIYAPRVAGSDLSDAPLCGFRIDVSLTLNAADFKLDMQRDCKEVVIRVLDGLLNKVH
ncbi:MAG: hypothetical protein IPP69_10930 [Flavobacteriales bacterium]|nr:hypothetical protein [Flavobacteriales bacterium]